MIAAHKHAVANGTGTGEHIAVHIHLGLAKDGHTGAKALEIVAAGAVRRHGQILDLVGGVIDHHSVEMLIVRVDPAPRKALAVIGSAYDGPGDALILRDFAAVHKQGGPVIAAALGHASRIEAFFRCNGYRLNGHGSRGASRDFLSLQQICNKLFLRHRLYPFLLSWQDVFIIRPAPAAVNPYEAVLLKIEPFCTIGTVHRLCLPVLAGYAIMDAQNGPPYGGPEHCI